MIYDEKSRWNCKHPTMIGQLYWCHSSLATLQCWMVTHGTGFHWCVKWMSNPKSSCPWGLKWFSPAICELYCWFAHGENHFRPHYNDIWQSRWNCKHPTMIGQLYWCHSSLIFLNGNPLMLNGTPVMDRKPLVHSFTSSNTSRANASDCHQCPVTSVDVHLVLVDAPSSWTICPAHEI